MKYLSLLAFFLLNIPSSSEQKQLHQEVESLLKEELAKENIHNTFLSVYSPSKEIEESFHLGEFSDGKPVTLNNPFYTASIGKTFTATAIALLVDQKKLKFNHKIAKHLPAETMKGLHVFEGKNYSNSITIAQLLQHTSGLPDYFGQQTADGSPSMFELLLTDTAKFWQPEELIAFSKEHFNPSFPPSKGYCYTDTEYVLLGMIVEKVSRMPLHQFFEKHFFQPLAMESTYFNLYSKPISPTNRMAEFHAGEYEISTLTSVSADWAGGAIVSTAKDLIRFQRALLNGEIVQPKTLKAMQNWTAEMHGMEYGFGLRKVNLQELSPELPNWHLIGHSGLNASFMYYCPELDIYLAGTLNQMEASRAAFEVMIKTLVLISHK